ncbi:hypothetical protein JHK82_052691 [Glycine max]|nr:hypothetical protein JHK82_052691 [Glycine max]
MQLRPNLKRRDVDELVLANWKSQGVTGSMYVLEDSEVLFFMIQVGSYVSKWITVKNPSQHPVVMQLILNLGEIINECKDLDYLLHPSSSSNLVLDEGATPKKYGFSVPKNALTEAYVHPHDHLTLGPIIFYPSDRCGWSGSELIRNNLSGVEWIPLKGYLGLLSLVLLERSEHVDNRKSKLSMSSEMNHLMEASSGKYSYGQGNPFELEISQQLTHKSENHEQTSHALDIQSERKLSSSIVQNFDPMKASQLGYLTVKPGKEKGIRRKRKSLGAKLVALSKVSSSQSGNSTPSSPLSPTPSATPKCNWPMSLDKGQPPEALSSMTQVATQHSANDQASATVVVSNILKPASTQRCANSKSSQVPHSASRSATSFLKYHKYYFMTKTSTIFTHLRL